MSEYIDILQSDEAEWLQKLWEPMPGDMFTVGSAVLLYTFNMDKTGYVFPKAARWKPTLEQLLDLVEGDWELFREDELAKLGCFIGEYWELFNSTELCAAVLKAVIAQHKSNAPICFAGNGAPDCGECGGCNDT